MSAAPVSPQLTKEMVQRTFEQMKLRMSSPPEHSYVICHPAEAWWQILHGASGWNWRRWKAFKSFWRYRRYFDDYHVMIVLSSIIRGEYP